MDSIIKTGRTDITYIPSPGRIRSDLYCFQNEFSSPSAIPSVIWVLSSIVERTVVRNKRLAVSNNPTFGFPKNHGFDGVEIPEMSIEQYLCRIFRYINCSPSVFVVAYVYIDRLIQFHQEFHITVFNVHRLLITSVMVASKFVEDINYPNSHYGSVGGFGVEEMNKLEIDFLFLLGFKLQVNVNVFESYCCHLEREVALGGGFHIERSLQLFCKNYETSAAATKHTKKQRQKIALQ